MGKSVLLIDRCPDSGPSHFGKQELLKALKGKGVSVRLAEHWANETGSVRLVIGTAQDRMVGPLLVKSGIRIDPEQEGVLYRRDDTDAGPVRVIAGTDERGLMYALLEMADRVRAHGIQELEEMRDLVEFPDIRIRGVDRFVMGPMDDGWYFSESFWNYYLSRLAHSRFNRLVLILGFDTPYYSPPYPFLMGVTGYPEVQVVGIDHRGRSRNLSQLKCIGQLCHSYGLEFILGTWQQIPWTKNQERIVEGLPQGEAELARYCSQGLKDLLGACPEIDGIHFRVNHEAGVGSQKTNESFWKECITAVAAVGRRLKLDLRAKGLTDDMIQFAINTGLEVTVPTKYWCEHTGLPYHLTQMREEELTRLDNLNHGRRYSYADLLRKPRRYEILYRLWNYGSTCVLLWGDSDYVRRFCESCRLGPASGFEISAPLSLKGGHSTGEDQPWPLSDDPSLRHYEWEDERYWLTYTLFGRLGYSGSAAADIWQRQFQERFGPEAAPELEAAYRAASKVLPLITAFHMPVHPSVQYWPELSTGGALFAEHNYNKTFRDRTYQNTEPSDPGLFYRITDYISDWLASCLRGKYTPLQVRVWFRSCVSEIRRSLDRTDNYKIASESAEYKATRFDLLMLAELADYHAAKIQAALALSLYQKTNEANLLTVALESMERAKKSWEALSERGRAAYHVPLDFAPASGAGRRGHWSDYLPELEKDVSRLRKLLHEADPPQGQGPGNLFEKELEPHRIEDMAERYLSSFKADLPKTCTTAEDLVITVNVGEAASLTGDLTMHYRHTNQTEGPFKVLTMKKTKGGYRGGIPGEYIVPEWDLLVYFSAVNNTGHGLIFPGLYHPDYPAPYHIIKVGAEG